MSESTQILKRKRDGNSFIDFVEFVITWIAFEYE